MTKVHPLMVDNTNDFVCISDVTGTYIPMNKVMYNPVLPIPSRKNMLQKISKEYFNVKLTETQLESLCECSNAQCYIFIEKYRDIISQNKK